MVAEPATKEQASATAGLEHVPQHVAIIMDGNGRWAKEHGHSRQAGHRAGTENIRRVIEAFAHYEVPTLSLYAFSTENWSRPRREVNYLIRLIDHFIERELKALDEHGVRLRHLGSLDPLSPPLRHRIEQAIEMTNSNDRITVNVAFNYGGRQEILDAVRRIVQDGVPADRIDEALFSSYLYTAGQPDPDLVIRTAGEQRLSNFLIWQSHYSEYYVTPKYWPDFDEAEIGQALTVYSQRQRRFGGRPDASDSNHDDTSPRGSAS
ncbi:MAG: polyprenyl diphosphate synthase [Dehalococcoidia bacterium]